MATDVMGGGADGAEALNDFGLAPAPFSLFTRLVVTNHN
jgi:hypothetical protein